MARDSEKPAIAAADTLFGPLVDSVATALGTPVALPALDLEEDPDSEAMTVVAYEEPELPKESERRRLHTDRIRARRIEALRRHRPAPQPARLAPSVTPVKPVASRPPRRPTVPARRPPNDWAQERTMLPQAFVQTRYAAFATHRGTFDSDARTMTMVSMLMSAVAGVFLAAALATLL